MQAVTLPAQNQGSTSSQTTTSKETSSNSLAAIQRTYSSLFTEEPSRRISSRSPVEMSRDTFLQKFISENPNDKLAQELGSIRWGSIHVENRTHQSINVPNERPLIEQAQKYQEKYQINIAVIGINDLNDFLKDLKNTVKEPAYFGIILSQGKQAHLIPLLVYLKPDDKGFYEEYVLLDSTGKNQQLQDILEKEKVSPRHIYTTSSPRQGDGSSCRTESIIILRNALLHLKQFSGGFSEALKTGEVNGLSIVHLPPTWDYTSQISNKLPNAENQIVPRTAYSKNPEKRDLKETVGEFRKRHTGTIDLHYSFTKEMQDDVKKWEDLTPSSESKWTVQLSDFDSIFDCFTVKIDLLLQRNVNHYLYEKGLKILSKTD